MVDLRRVVVTGIGLIGPTGPGVDAMWQALLRGNSPLSRIRRFDPTGYPCQVGGEVEDAWFTDLIPSRLVRNGTHAAQLAVGAARLACQDGGLDPQSMPNTDSLGVALGTALGGWREGEEQHAILLERGVRRVNPFVANSAPNHAPAAEVANFVGARGAQLTYSTGCAASLQAIVHAANLIALGELDTCLAGGSESPLTSVVIAAMGRTLELAKDAEVPARASRPFDRGHSGIVLSEGGCVLVLEAEETAARRGAKVYAEVLGGRSSCDAQGLYQVEASGEVGARTVRELLSRHRLDVADLHWVCAHANSSPTFDRKETSVLRRAFGNLADRIPVSSIKAITGHPFGAAGAFQTATACLALREQVIPPTHHFEVAAPECDLDYVPNVPRSAPIEHVLVSSYGYGGVNCYLLLRRPARL